MSMTTFAWANEFLPGFSLLLFIDRLLAGFGVCQDRNMVLKKYEIESALHEEHKAISAGQLKEDNPLDQSDEFETLCEACRRGDLKVCQEKLQDGVNINARDGFDDTPLILVSFHPTFDRPRVNLRLRRTCPTKPQAYRPGC